MSLNRYDSEGIRAALTPFSVLQRFGWKSTLVSGWHRSRECPSCGGSESDAFVVGEYGFVCHRCESKGDLLSLVALFADMDCKRDFQRVLHLAAEITGIEPVTHDLTISERQERDWIRSTRRDSESRRRQEQDAQRVEKAAVIASELWNGLGPTSTAGEAYARLRGLGELLECADVLRFDIQGNVRIPLYDGAGRIINVPGRYLPGKEPSKGRRILNVKGCPTKGTFGNPNAIRRKAGDVIVTEGIFDYLSGLLIWPNQAIFGAHGGNNLKHVARYVAGQIHDTDRSLWIVPHCDKAGEKAAHDALEVATEAGLPIARIHFYDVSSAGDLNDWLQAKDTKDSQP